MNAQQHKKKLTSLEAERVSGHVTPPLFSRLAPQPRIFIATLSYTPESRALLSYPHVSLECT